MYCNKSLFFAVPPAADLFGLTISLFPVVGISILATGVLRSRL